MFAPLSPSVAGVAGRPADPVPVGAGEVVVREGDVADRFFVIESGLVEVTQRGRVLRREGPGDFFGEIGLLRDVPRTATVTAVEDTVLHGARPDDFLDAVTGQRRRPLGGRGHRHPSADGVRSSRDHTAPPAGRAARTAPGSASAAAPRSSAPSCAACGTELVPGARFCSGCGAAAGAAAGRSGHGRGRWPAVA